VVEVTPFARAKPARKEVRGPPSAKSAKEGKTTSAMSEQRDLDTREKRICAGGSNYERSCLFTEGQHIDKRVKFGGGVGLFETSERPGTSKRKKKVSWSEPDSILVGSASKKGGHDEEGTQFTELCSKKKNQHGRKQSDERIGAFGNRRKKPNGFLPGRSKRRTCNTKFCLNMKNGPVV